MSELQIILIVCAVVFVGSLYWWGRKDKEQPLQRAYRAQDKDDLMNVDEEFEIVPVIKHGTLKAETHHVEHFQEPNISALDPEFQQDNASNLSEATMQTATEMSEAAAAEPEQAALVFSENTSHHDDASTDTIAERVQDLDDVPSVHRQASQANTQQQEPQEMGEAESQVFALLVLSASQKFKRKDLHVAMEASRLSFHEDGTYVKTDSQGNVVFRVANVVEPGYFPPLDDVEFESPGVALVLALPSSITPYRAMDEFITVARKVSQNLNAKLYDAQRHIIKESDLKMMREYAQNLTY